ncbi:hypothetical protein BO94DRAFT_573943 [Aspergillus sclerotioniger CBS 115572]|uniref:Ankyrin n=1 Tax=Aspergillus sclerotioniger CBS 115572 TaxID=1450535 RepID=A0A317X1P2_9EURO|nr:hypothetical protein BO94DRAFT_573943 [Aspergillus sclerotioniger CBS 115572]PWY91522.1 hypothetical protein BO94DRAFT_573943 [Aspergillus sclerotioniger CBS 115572]
MAHVFHAICGMRSGPRLLKLALDNGTDIRAMDPLYDAVKCRNPNVLKMVLTSIPKLLHTQGSETALSTAVLHCRPQNAMVLLRKGIRISPPVGMYAQSALQRAVERGFFKVVDAILSRPELGSAGWTAELMKCIIVAKERKYWKVMGSLLRCYRRSGGKSLPDCLKGHKQEVGRLLKHFEDISAPLR